MQKIDRQEQFITAHQRNLGKTVQILYSLGDIVPKMYGHNGKF